MKIKIRKKTNVATRWDIREAGGPALPVGYIRKLHDGRYQLRIDILGDTPDEFFETLKEANRSAELQLEKVAREGHAQPSTESAPAQSVSLTRVELALLSFSPANSRRQIGATDDLEASIAAYGLLENLVITDDGQVVAGARRLQALRNMAERGELVRTDIPCRVIAAAAAVGASLAENTMRVALHPVDEAAAFANCVDGGSSVAEIAANFGCSERVVEQRLKIAGVSHGILQAYRGGEVTMDTVQAFTVTNDQARQAEVYSQLDRAADRGVSKWTVQQALREDCVQLTSNLGRFVGLEAYVQAGGAVTEDIFAQQDDSGVRLDDRALVIELAERKLVRHAKALKLRKHWKWVDIRRDFDYLDKSQYSRIAATLYELSAEERDELAALDDRIAAYLSTAVDQRSEESRQNYPQWLARMDELEDLENSMAHFDAEEMKRAGCVVSIGGSGQVVVDRGLMRPNDVVEPGGGADPAKEKAKPLSESLRTDLRMVRATIVKAALTDDFEACFDLLTFCLARNVVSEYGDSGGLDISATDTRTRVDAARENEDYDAWCAEGGKFTEQVELLPGRILGSRDSFAEFRELPMSKRRSIFSTSVAMTLRPQSADDRLSHAEIEQTIARMQLDFTGKVRLTDKLFWGRLSKPQILAIAKKVIGKKFAEDRKDDPKSRLAELMHNTFDPGRRSGWLTDAQLTRVRAYLPEGFVSRPGGSQK